MEKEPGKYDLILLIFFTGFALLIDLFLFWFDLTGLGVTAFILVFFLLRIETGLAKWVALGLSLIYIPATTGFVVAVYLMNTSYVKKRLAKVGPAGQVAIQAAAAAGGDVNAAKSAAAGAAKAGANAKGAATTAAKGRSAATGSEARPSAPGTPAAQPEGQDSQEGGAGSGGQPSGGSRPDRSRRRLENGETGQSDDEEAQEQDEYDADLKQREEAAKGAIFPGENPSIETPTSAQLPTKEEISKKKAA